MTRLPLFAAWLTLALSASSQAEEKTPLSLTPVQRANKAELHQSFNEISKAGEAQLVFLGDSITQGWSGRGKEVWE